MIARLLGALSACAMSLAVGPAGSDTLISVQDSYTNRVEANRSHGDHSLVKVKHWGPKYGFVQFDLSSIAGRSIESATLSMDIVRVLKLRRATGFLDLRLVEGAWSEDTLAYSNQPKLSAPLARVAISAENEGDSFSVDITSLVQDWVDGTIPNYGFALTSSDSGEIYVQLATGARLDVQLGGGQDTGLGQVELNWAPPHTRTDGTPLALSEIAGYVLRMNGRWLSNAISADAVTVTVSDLWPGEYCFQIAARDRQGRVGPFSAAHCWDVVAEAQ